MKKKLNVYKQQTVINHNTVKPESMSMLTFLWTNYNKYLILVKKRIYVYFFFFFDRIFKNVYFVICLI